MAVCLGALAFTVYIFTRTDVHGGKSYGERYFLSLVPLVALFAVFTLPARRPRVALLLLAVAAALSVVSAWQGVRRTWTVTPPVLYLDAQRLGVCSSLADADDPCLGLVHPAPRRPAPRKPAR
jgi:asparagine N-glycosylation enzyme membrane subunit Stt3